MALVQRRGPRQFGSRGAHYGASTAAGGVHQPRAVAATVVGEEVESRRRHLVVGEEVRPAAVGHDDLERVAGQRRAGRID